MRYFGRDESARACQTVSHGKSMTKTRHLLSLAMLIGLLGAAGCSTQSTQHAVAPGNMAPQGTEAVSTARHDSDAAMLQGKWVGQEVGRENEGSCSLAISGKHMEFHGVNPQEWYKGTISLLENSNPKQVVVAITGCAEPKYVGKASHAIYRIENGALHIT